MNSRVVVVAVLVAGVSVAVAVGVEIALGELKSRRAGFFADEPARYLIEGRVGAGPDARQARLVGGIAIGSPLQVDVYTWTFFQAKKIAVGPGLEFAQAAWEIGVAGQQGKCRGRRV